MDSIEFESAITGRPDGRGRLPVRFMKSGRRYRIVASHSDPGKFDVLHKAFDPKWGMYGEHGWVSTDFKHYVGPALVEPKSATLDEAISRAEGHNHQMRLEAARRREEEEERKTRLSEKAKRIEEAEDQIRKGHHRR